jgi:hypothetical protein
MATSPRVHVEEQKPIVDIKREPRSFDDLESDLEDEVEFAGPQIIYYQSKQVLGELYREIDEREFLATFQSNTRHLEEQNRTRDPLATRLWAYVRRETPDIKWQHHLDWAEEVKSSYESHLLDTVHQFSVHPSQPVTETEVFVGTLLGRGNAVASRRAREANKDMKDKFDRDAAFIVSCITHGSGQEVGEAGDVLARAVACFSVAMKPAQARSKRTMKSKLESFRYIAAAICLKELRKTSPAHNHAAFQNGSD